MVSEKFDFSELELFLEHFTVQFSSKFSIGILMESSWLQANYEFSATQVPALEGASRGNGAALAGVHEGTVAEGKLCVT